MTRQPTPRPCRRPVPQRLRARAAPAPRRRLPPGRTLLGIAVAFALACTLPVAAQQVASQLEHPTEDDPDRVQGLEWEAELGAAYSDNRGRSENGEDDLWLAPRVSFSWLRLGPRLQARAEGRIEALQSLGSTFDDELRVRLSAMLDWAVIPQRLYWTVQDFAGVEPIDALDSPGPDNLQQTNVFITGPTFRLFPGGLWDGEIYGRYTDSWAEETRSFRGDRTEGGALLGRMFGQARSLWIGAERTDVNYDEPLRFIGGTDPSIPDDIELGDPNHDRTDTWLSYRSNFPRLFVELTLGRTRIEFDRGDELSGTLARAFARLTHTEDHVFTAQFVREYSDAVRDLVSQVGEVDPTINLRGRPEVGPGIYLLRGAQLGYQYRWPRGQVEVTPFHRDYDYQLDTDFLDQRSRGVRGEVAWLVNPRTTLRGEVGIEDREFEHFDRSDDNMYAAVLVERRLSRHWAVRGGFSHHRRNSTALGADYRENVVSASLVYFGDR